MPRLGLILSAFLMAVRDMFAPPLRWVFVKAVGLTLALFLGLAWFVAWLVPDRIVLPFFGEIGWLSDALNAVSFLGVLGASVFLMVPVAALFTGLFLEEVADNVEKLHYRDLPPPRGATLLEALIDAVQFTVLLVVVNIFAFFVGLLLGPLAPVLWWGVNGFLLGREYFSVVALRRMKRREMKRLLRRHFLTIWAAGVVMAIPLSVPVMNIVIPVLGVAAITHLFHRLRQQESARG